jgi:hypothetical protein
LASRLLDVFFSSSFFFAPLTFLFRRISSSSAPDCDSGTLFLFLFGDLETLMVEEGVKEVARPFVVVRTAEADVRSVGEVDLTLGGLLWRSSTFFGSVERAVKKCMKSLGLLAELPPAALTDRIDVTTLSGCFLFANETVYLDS